MSYTEKLAAELADEMHELSVAVLGRAVPAPELYEVLGNVKLAAGSLLAELLGRLADGIERSIDEFEVYEARGGSPVTNAAAAASLLQGAAAHADRVLRLLDEAQTAICWQGHRGRIDAVRVVGSAGQGQD